MFNFTARDLFKAESDEASLKDLEAENKELMLTVARLEAALEEQRSGPSM